MFIGGKYAFGAKVVEKNETHISCPVHFSVSVKVL
jgi:hypothetical protein